MPPLTMATSESKVVWLLLPPSELSTEDSAESDAVCDDAGYWLLSSLLLGGMRYRGMVVDQLTAR